MAVSPGYKDFLHELFAPLGPVSVRGMFGGAGVFMDDVMFALVADDTLYLKADETTLADFADEGMSAFSYEVRGKRATMSYWQVPDRLLEDPEELAIWSRKAITVAEKVKRRGRTKHRRS